MLMTEQRMCLQERLASELAASLGSSTGSSSMRTATVCRLSWPGAPRANASKLSTASTPARPHGLAQHCGGGTAEHAAG